MSARTRYASKRWVMLGSKLPELFRESWGSEGEHVHGAPARLGPRIPGDGGPYLPSMSLVASAQIARVAVTHSARPMLLS